LRCCGQMIVEVLMRPATSQFMESSLLQSFEMTVLAFQSVAGEVCSNKLRP